MSEQQKNYYSKTHTLAQSACMPRHKRYTATRTVISWKRVEQRSAPNRTMAFFIVPLRLDSGSRVASARACSRTVSKFVREMFASVNVVLCDVSELLAGVKSDRIECTNGATKRRLWTASVFVCRVTICFRVRGVDRLYILRMLYL